MKRYVCFPISFLLMTTAATLLLTWSLWWLFVVPDSVPARRSFFRDLDDPPNLIAQASEFARDTRSIFVYSLAGGWPTLNSVLRISATLLAMLAALSFAFIATFAHEKSTRTIFTVFLVIVTVLALASSVTDSLALDAVRKECGSNKCTTAIPDDLGSTIQAQQANLKCRCSPDAWFWVTLAMDWILTASAGVCLGITVVPWVMKCMGRGDFERTHSIASF